MRAAATTSLERTEYLKGDWTKQVRPEKKRIVYNLMQKKGGYELSAVEGPRITPSRSSYSSGDMLGNAERIAW